MKKLALTALTAALVSTSAFAGTHIDTRGYQECERSLSKEFGDSGVMFKRHYVVKRAGDERTFYINKTIWNDGVRTPVATTCVTSRNGRDILTLDSDFSPHVDIQDVVATR